MPRKIVHRNWREIAFAVVALALVAYGMRGLGVAYRASHAANPVSGIKAVATASGKIPDETPIGIHADYAVPADQPRAIKISSVGIEGLIQRVSVDATTSLAVPTNVHVAGWYMGGPRPGEEGVSVIDGHVQGTYQRGIFKKLDQVKPGDGIQIIFGDDSVKMFKTVSVRSYPVAEAGAALFAQDPSISRQLTLVTCAGDYDKSSGGYPDRVIVVARKI